LEKALSNQLNVVLTSPRRMGKTSLVSYVFDKPSIAGEYVTITIDILHTTTFREFIMTFGTAYLMPWHLGVTVGENSL